MAIQLRLGLLSVRRARVDLTHRPDPCPCRTHLVSTGLKLGLTCTEHLPPGRRFFWKNECRIKPRISIRPAKGRVSIWMYDALDFSTDRYCRRGQTCESVSRSESSTTAAAGLGQGDPVHPSTAPFLSLRFRLSHLAQNGDSRQLPGSLAYAAGLKLCP